MESSGNVVEFDIRLGCDCGDDVVEARATEEKMLDNFILDGYAYYRE